MKTRHVLIMIFIIVVMLFATFMKIAKRSEVLYRTQQMVYKTQQNIYVCTNYLSERCLLAKQVAELLYPNYNISEYLGQDTHREDILIVVCGCGHANSFHGIILYVDNGQGKLHLPGVTEKKVVYAGVQFPYQSELIVQRINLFFVSVVAALLSAISKDVIERYKYQTHRSFLEYHSSYCINDADRVFDILVDVANNEGFDTPVASGNCLRNHPKWLNGTNNCTDPGRCDIEHLTRYRFCHIMDNDVKGFVTQKILHAFLAGCIPIYYGTKDVFNLFNRDSFIYFDLKNPQEAIKQIIYLQKNNDAYLRMISAPVLANGYNTARDFFSLRSCVGGGKLRKAILHTVDFGKSQYLQKQHVLSTSLNYSNIRKLKNSFSTKDIFIPFYIYNDSECAMQNWSSCLKNDVDTALILMFKKHPWRTKIASKAKVFIIPTPIYASYKCDNKNHMERLRKTMEIIVSNQYFKRYNGRDHLFMAHTWQYSVWADDSQKMMGIWWNKLSEVTTLRYEYYGMSKWENSLSFDRELRVPKALYNTLWEPTKRSLVAPYTTPLELNIVTPTYHEWTGRSNLIWYHTRSSKSAHGATKLRHLPVQKRILFPGDIGFEMPHGKWISGWSKSKFCPVIRGDTPSSHSFYNALASSCVPVIISDSFELVGFPFKDVIPLRSIAVQFSEKQFLNAPETIVPMLRNISDEDIKTKLLNIKLVQPMFIIKHKKSIIAELILKNFLDIVENIFSMHQFISSQN